MRLLWLTNGFPYPLTSGYLRHYFLLRELSRDHAITLMSIVAPSFRPEHADALKPFTERVEVFPVDPPALTRRDVRKRLMIHLEVVTEQRHPQSAATLE